MRVFVTGATGFIGSAVVRELLDNGHQVLGLARSDDGAHAVEAAGADVHRGSLEDLESLRDGAAASDGVIHTAFIHDFTNYAPAAAADRVAIETIGDVLADSGKPFVVSGGVALISPGRTVTEDDAPDPRMAGMLPRVSEQTALALASRGVRTSVMRLSPSVHGDGDHGFVPMLIRLARDKGMSAYIGEGHNRWPGVHRLDAARLFRLALEKAPAGTKLHAVADEGVAFKDIANAIGAGLGVPVASVAPDKAGEHFGWMATFASLDCPASSALTRERFGWQPNQPDLIADLQHGTYFEAYAKV